jgi:hypothetical protein
MKHIHHHKRSAIEQNHVTADHDMLAIRRRRWKVALQISGTMHNFRPKSWRQSAADDQLALKARWQSITLGQAGRQMLIIRAVPASHLVAVVIGIGATIVSAIMLAIVVFFVPSIMFTAMVLIVIVAIVLVVTVAMILRYRRGH